MQKKCALRLDSVTNIRYVTVIHKVEIKNKEEEMIYEGIETENYTEREFCALPRKGRRTLLRAKEAGAKFAPEKELPPAILGPGPSWKRAADEKYTLPREKAARRDKDGGLWGAAPIGPNKTDGTKRDRQGNPVGTKYDAYGNIIDGEEMI